MSGYFSSLGLNQSEIMSIVNTANMQGAYASAMMNPSYMTGSIFNSSMPSLPALPTMDMNMSLSTPAWLQNIGNTPAQFDFSGMNTGNPFSLSNGTITDEDGEKLTMSEYAKKHGYEETMTDGVYKRNGKYYRYNASLKKFTEITKAEKAQVEKSEREAKNAEKANTYKDQLKSTKSEREKEAKNIAADVYDSIKGWGTKDKKLAQTVSKINKDNVIEVWEMWENNHEVDFGSEGGLMKSIADDTSGKDLKKYTKQIKNALIARAEALGMTDEVEQARTTSDEDFDFDSIVKAIKNKERE